MANLKFSDFTPYATTPVTATSGLVAYEGTTNIQFTPTQLAPFTGIYAANGTIGTTRKALITDTIQFRNAGDTKDVFKLNTTGAFALGLDAANTSETNVCIGIEATTSSVYGVAIGRKVTMSNLASFATVIGNQSAATASQSVIVGAYSGAGPYSITIGTSAGSAASYATNIGHGATGSGANSITINASSTAAAPTTANAFGVYMTSNTSADLEVVGGGESTLRTSLLIPGTESNITINPDQQDAFTIDSIDGASNDFFTIKRAGAVKVQIGLIGAFNGGISLFDNTQATQLQLRATSTGNFIKPNIHLGNSTEAAEKLEVTGNIKVTGQAYTELHTGATPADPDWNNSNIQEMTLASLDQDFDPTNAKAGATYILKIKQPSSGTAGTINWNAASATVLWPAGAPPTLSTANNAVDIVTLICTDSASGGTYYANATLNFS